MFVKASFYSNTYQVIQYSFINDPLYTQMCLFKKKKKNRGIAECSNRTKKRRREKESEGESESMKERDERKRWLSKESLCQCDCILSVCSAFM